MVHVISKNYLNRNSSLKWLMRSSEQQPEEAVETKWLLMKNVSLVPSTAYETGFGCSIVANTQEVDLGPKSGLAAQGFKRAYFMGNAFYINNEYGSRFYFVKAEEMYLGHSGKVFVKNPSHE